MAYGGEKHTYQVPLSVQVRSNSYTGVLGCLEEVQFSLEVSRGPLHNLVTLGFDYDLERCTVGLDRLRVHSKSIVWGFRREGWLSIWE